MMHQVSMDLSGLHLGQLTQSIKYNTWNLMSLKKNNLKIKFQKLSKFFSLKGEYTEFYNKGAFYEEVQKEFKKIMIESCYLGFPKEKLMDFYSFLILDFIACDYDIHIWLPKNVC